MASKITSLWQRTSRGIATTASPSAAPKLRGDYVPVYVALGLIMLSSSLGLYTLKTQLSDHPSVRVSKKRRETLPEVEEPELVAEEGNRYINRSIFRKVANMQDFDAVRAGITDPMRARDALEGRARVESLKSVGVDARAPAV